MRRTFWPNRIFQRSRSKNRSAAFYENCTKRTFQAMRRTFWPNRISQRLRAKNRSAGQKFTPIRENSKLCMKIVQNVLFRPCGERFGQIAFFKVLDAKIALPDWNSRQYVKAVGLPCKLYKTCFSGHAEDVLTKSHFSTFRSQKSLCGTEIHANR